MRTGYIEQVNAVYGQGYTLQADLTRDIPESPVGGDHRYALLDTLVQRYSRVGFRTCYLRASYEEIDGVLGWCAPRGVRVPCAVPLPNGEYQLTVTW